MARVADRSVVAVWHDRIERQQRSGLSIQAFCQEEGVAQGTFYAGKRRGKAKGQPVVRDAKRNATSAAVRRKSRRERLIEIPLNIDSSIQVRFADGTTVHVPAAQLAVTLQTLQSRQPGGASDV
jgi:SOS-response transcriptional repressor LexA